jgi:hypothetical protein
LTVRLWIDLYVLKKANIATDTSLLSNHVTKVKGRANVESVPRRGFKAVSRGTRYVFLNKDHCMNDLIACEIGGVYTRVVLIVEGSLVKVLITGEDTSCNLRRELDAVGDGIKGDRSIPKVNWKSVRAIAIENWHEGVDEGLVVHLLHLAHLIDVRGPTIDLDARVCNAESGSRKDRSD